MQLYTIKTSVPVPDPAKVFEILADFTHYVEYSTAVRHVSITPIDETRSLSFWDVRFRRGILRWTEEDHFDREHRRIAFRQTEGDMDVFEGSWQIFPAGEHCIIDFTTTFDLGIPGLEEVLDPIAVDALHENIELIMRGLFGPGAETISWSSSAVVPEAVGGGGAS